MSDNERKDKFVELLEELLADYDGIKLRLADKLGVKSSTLTPWFQGKVDPASIELSFFVRIAETANYSTDELVKRLEILEKSEETILDKFKNLIRDLLSTQTQQTLAKKIGVSESAVGTWVRKKRAIDPRKVSIATIAAIAREKNWTIERLLIYLDLKETAARENLSFRLKTDVTVLSLPEQIDLLAWLSSLVTGKLKESETIPEFSKKLDFIDTNSARTICIILEKEDMALVSNYTGNLSLHFQIRPENITLATPRSLPDSLSIFDVLLFDLNNQQSPCIPLIDSLQFDGDVVAFVARSLPEDIQDRLKEKVTEVIVKPVPWSELKRQAYFS